MMLGGWAVVRACIRNDGRVENVDDEEGYATGPPTESPCSPPLPQPAEGSGLAGRTTTDRPADWLAGLGG